MATIQTCPRLTSFLELPTEVRNIIYQLALIDSHPINIPYSAFPNVEDQEVDLDVCSDTTDHGSCLAQINSVEEQKRFLTPQLPRLNRQIREEATVFLYSHNSFVCYERKLLAAFLSAIGRNIQYIEDISVHFWNYCWDDIDLLCSAPQLRRLHINRLGYPEKGKVYQWNNLELHTTMGLIYFSVGQWVEHKKSTGKDWKCLFSFTSPMPGVFDEDFRSEFIKLATQKGRRSEPKNYAGRSKSFKRERRREKQRRQLDTEMTALSLYDEDLMQPYTCLSCQQLSRICYIQDPQKVHDEQMSRWSLSPEWRAWRHNEWQRDNALDKDHLSSFLKAR
ncbi:hypothetical protein EJ08DRAFT_196436 [Tothia fuscella]|uniref:Uncharacterized protein n=1 Tax=Tothia fuscella TaxID=1048955 RepID=A0A9P4NU93_9PEZI|nr:hypothetical protein EJ08DRAFT_196436 [Tothia fuscella]